MNYRKLDVLSANGSVVLRDGPAIPPAEWEGLEYVDWKSGGDTNFAPLASAMGMKVLISDPYATVEEPRFQQVDLATLLASSDHVVCLAVANEATERLINAEAFARMRRDAVFINVSRGNLVDETALAAALAEGKIAGAALDVGRAPDQMPTPAIAAIPNVIATPHIGGLTPPAIEAQALHTVEQVRALVSRAVPDGAVNAEAWTRKI